MNDYNEIFKRLKSVDFNGWISIEDGMNGLEEMRQSVDFLKAMRRGGFAVSSVAAALAGMALTVVVAVALAVLMAVVVVVAAGHTAVCERTAGMTTEPNKSQGYAVYTNASLVQEFKDAALALDKVGDTTELVASSYGYHIIKFVSEPTVGPIAFETVKSTVSDNLLNSKKVELWNATVTEWREGMTVEIHTDLFHSKAADSE